MTIPAMASPRPVSSLLSIFLSAMIPNVIDKMTISQPRSGIHPINKLSIPRIREAIANPDVLLIQPLFTKRDINVSDVSMKNE